jgi:hypothetical protein
MELDADQVARTFGVALPIGPLPESPFPATHAEDAASAIMLDTRAPRPTPAAPILEIAMRRLQSLKPRTAERKAEVKAVIAALAAPLEALDLLIAETEQEHFNAIDARWQECRKRGRTLIDEIIPQLEGEKYKWQQEAQKSGEQKAQRGVDAQTFWWERQRISEWASEKEIAAADKRLENARAASAAATQLALDDQRSLAVAESALESAKATLATLKTELHRLATELRGEPYFDPELGLSRDPLFYKEKW